MKNMTFAVYEIEPDWKKVLGQTITLDNLKPVTKGHVPTGFFDLGLRCVDESAKAWEGVFGMRFEGQIEIPISGDHKFRLWADGQARLFIDGKLVVEFLDNGGDPKDKGIS